VRGCPRSRREPAADPQGSDRSPSSALRMERPPDAMRPHIWASKIERLPA
jgi:hypothetical protein